jgi:dTDP-4-dehydrorhamnose reductase
MIGHQIYSELSQEFKQVKVCIRKPAAYALKFGLFEPNHVIDNVDLLHERTLEVTLKNVNPDLIINCAGSTLAKTKTLAAPEVIELNALFPQRLYQWCLNHSAFLIHFSNDEIFAGREMPYDENSLPDSRTVYGRAKALGEIDGPQSLTLRSSFLGPELENSTELFSKLCADPNQTVAASRSQFFCGVTTLYLSTLVADWVRHGLPLTGLYQVAAQPISEVELMHLFNRQFGWNLNISEIPGITSYPKLLSNQKLTKDWPTPPPRWSDLIYELKGCIERQSYLRKAA